MPKPSAIDRNWEQNRELLAEAARNADVDPAILVKIAGFESGFDTHARPVSRSHPKHNVIRQFDGTMALSSAYGLGQFTKDTWLSVIHRHGEKYGVANAARMTEEQANGPALRNDPRLQAAMLAEFTRDNIARGRALGGPDPDANVYALHNLGSGDGPKFLEALRNNPGAPVNTVLSAKVIRGNPTLYGDGSRTLEDAYRVMGAKMDEYANYAARIGTAPPRQEAAPAPAPVRHTVPAASDMQNRAAIYNEARLHFIDGRERFEYGRGDTAAGRTMVVMAAPTKAATSATSTVTGARASTALPSSGAAFATPVTTCPQLRSRRVTSSTDAMSRPTPGDTSTWSQRIRPDGPTAHCSPATS